MKILSSEQMYQADKATIKNKSITSIDLMEHAADKCFQWILEHFPEKKQVFQVFCGVGNNGGDGLVIARKLLQTGNQVKIIIVNFSKNRSSDFTANYKRLLELNPQICELHWGDLTFPEINKNDLVIDAIFGIGLSRTPDDFVKRILQKINDSQAKIIAVDMPSGLFSEAPVQDKDAVIMATYTLTFQNPKLAFFLSDNENFSKNWQVLDIGLDKDFIAGLNSPFLTVDKDLIQSIYKKRRKFSHKGTYGHSMLIGGSFGKMGAAVLASRAALKIGSGLVTAYIPKCGYEIVQISNPEVMVEVDDENYLQYFNFKSKPRVIGIGMGMGTHVKTIQGLEIFLKENRLSLVVDADAINILSMHPEYLSLLPKNTVITPHPKEFERLAGTWKNDYEKLEKLLNFSTKHKCIVVLKGAYTAIAHENKIYFNTTGNAALATAGSGDVLTGMITGLLAQNYTPLEAAIFGVYLHGKTADIALPEMGYETFIASSILDYLPNSFLDLY